MRQRMAKHEQEEKKVPDQPPDQPPDDLKKLKVESDASSEKESNLNIMCCPIC